MAQAANGGQDGYYMVEVPEGRASHLVVDGQVFFFGSVASVSASEFTLKPPDEPLDPDDQLRPGRTYDAVIYLGQHDQETPVELAFEVAEAEGRAILCRIVRISDRGQEQLHKFVLEIQVDGRRQEVERSIDLVEVKDD